MSKALRVLGIDVPDGLLEQWARWFAPDRQPFLVAADDDLAGPDSTALPPELRDTFEVYSLPDGLRIAWLTEDAFGDLGRRRRAELVRAQVRQERGVVPTVRAWSALVGDTVKEQADGRRFVWWPRLLKGHEPAVLADYVTEGRRPSQHDRVAAPTWRAAEPLLLGARAIAGTFPAGSGPNCFGTVMAAAGVEGADREWMQRQPFEDWLARSTVPGGDDPRPGTVLVWRSPDGAAQHAAVTLGDGWALHKPSQGWMSPTKVLTVRDVIASARSEGRRLTRRRLAQQTAL